LPGERQLCAHLQISRRTLRAALDELQRSGWLEVTHGQSRKIKPQRIKRGSLPQRKEIAVLSSCSHVEMSSLMMFALDVLREKLARVGYDTRLHVHPACFSEHPGRSLDKLVLQYPAAAWLIFGSKEPMQRWFIERQLPCIVAGSCDATINLPSVDSDHHAACLHAGNLLLRKGHRRLALVLPGDAFGGDLASAAGLREAVASFREPAELSVISHNGTTANLCALLDRALRLSAPPTAFVVARPIHSLTVMMHLLRRGKRIPQDIAVIAREDDPLLRCASPTLAHYADSPEQFARRLALAARQIAEAKALAPHPIRLVPRFVPGESV
jgi:DNA-binding LacI/PurR family transcriptional regulator